MQTTVVLPLVDENDCQGSFRVAYSAKIHFLVVSLIVMFLSITI